MVIFVETQNFVSPQLITLKRYKPKILCPCEINQ